MMPEPSKPSPPSVSELQDRLRGVAQTLRHSSTIDEDSRQALAELVEELNKALQAQSVPPAEVSRLAESTAHLAESLHHPKGKGLLGTAREGLERAAFEAESHA